MTGDEGLYYENQVFTKSLIQIVQLNLNLANLQIWQ